MDFRAFQTKLISMLSDYEGERIAVAVSGGRDSVCLLHLLKNSLPKLSVSAIHVHHGIRQTADRDAAFVEELCQKWNIPLKLYQVDAPLFARENGLSLEQAARQLRYECFENSSADVILLAHHQDDQAETVLMHLLRGSGLTGLSGMKSISQKEAQGKIYLRPLLSMSRDEINSYIEEHQLDFCEDETNQDPSYFRNRIRLELMPLLKTYQPASAQLICQSAETLREDEEFLTKLAEKAFDDMNRQMSLSALQTLALPVRKRVLKLWLKQEENIDGVNFTKTHWDALAFLCDAPTGTCLNFPGDLTLRRSYDKIVIRNSVSEVPQDMKFSFSCQKVSAPDTALLREIHADRAYLSAELCSRINELSIRTRQEGDYFYMDAEHTKLLSDFFTDIKMDQTQRDQTLLLCHQSEVLWICGFRVSGRYYVGPNDSEAALVSVLPC